MRITRSLSLIAACLLIAACSEKPENPSPGQGDGTTVEVAIPAESNLVWKKGDRIAVVENHGAPDQVSSVFEISEGTGTKNGLFKHVSGHADAENFTAVLYPEEALDLPEVPHVQCYAEEGPDPKAIRMEWKVEGEPAAQPVELENRSALLSFRLTGNGEKLNEIIFKTPEETYTLKVPQIALTERIRNFHLVLPAIKSRNAEILFNAVSGNDKVQMRRTLATEFVKAGCRYQFPLMGFDASVETREMNLAFYNVAVFSRDLPADPQSEGHIPTIAAMMKEKRVDAMLLAELDKNNKRHNYDQLAVFAEKMNWNSTFAKAFDYGKDILHLNAAYGNGAAYDKKYKMLETFNINFPKYGQEKEDRVCLVVEFEHFVLAGVHMPLYAENSLSAATKLTQELKTRYAGKDKPVFLCGDMNAKPGDATILELKKNWTRISPEEFTCPAASPTKCLDYIFAMKGTGSYEVLYSEVCKGFRSGDEKVTSDHLPVFATIRYVLPSSTPVPSDSPIESLW